MPWDSGQNKFIRTNDVGSTGSQVWQDDKNATPTPIKIRADRHDYHDQDIADGISDCLNLDGYSVMRSNLQMGNFKITNLGNGALNTDAANFGQLISAMSFDEPSRTLTLTRPTGGNFTAVISGGVGGGSGTVTSIDIGEGLSGTSDPITTTGDINLATIGTLQTFSGGISSVTVDKHGRVTQVIEGAFANTNLAIGTRTSTSLQVTSSTGTDVELPLASTSFAGLLSAADKSTLDGLSSGGVPAILSNGTTPSLNTGITATEVRDLIGAGTGDITNVSAGNGLTGGASSGSATVTLGTPGTLTGSSTNSVSATSHTHSISLTAADVGAATTAHGHPDLNALDSSPTFTGAVAALSFNATSARWKKDVTGFLSLDKAYQLINLSPFKYTLRNEPEAKEQVGLFADDVSEIYPEMTGRNGDGLADSIDYSRLVLPLMMIIQEMNDRMVEAGI